MNPSTPCRAESSSSISTSTSSNMTSGRERFYQRYRDFIKRGLSPLVDSDSQRPEMLNRYRGRQLISIMENQSNEFQRNSEITPKRDIVQIKQTTQPRSSRIFTSTIGPYYISTPLGRNDSKRDIPTSTPRSRHRIINPFDENLLESLSQPTFSPNVFSKIVSPSENESRASFRWSIDQLASLQPAEIDEEQQATSSDKDSDMESKIQATIDNFFSQGLIAPSPALLQEGAVALVNQQNQSNSLLLRSGVRSVPCQTLLTFPSGFDINTFFADSVFWYNDNEQSSRDKSIFNVSSLRRQLFPSPPENVENETQIEAVQPISPKVVEFLYDSQLDEELDAPFVLPPDSGGSFKRSSWPSSDRTIPNDFSPVVPRPSDEEKDSHSSEQETALLTTLQDESAFGLSSLRIKSQPNLETELNRHQLNDESMHTQCSSRDCRDDFELHNLHRRSSTMEQDGQRLTGLWVGSSVPKVYTSRPLITNNTTTTSTTMVTDSGFSSANFTSSSSSSANHTSAQSKPLTSELDDITWLPNCASTPHRNTQQ
ncbi:Protein aurora borealis [Trichinella nativa]|uniref:Protein aurora borealis n=1 Tax=Trichinella nativa TaxID=6335 RepID=A0A0V1LGS0_9BILA|nr:Protein aurora borealis [Trichinella sp. T6]KRZ58713.1 Protein aurora borealis [Trichinella nativa]